LIPLVSDLVRVAGVYGVAATGASELGVRRAGARGFLIRGNSFNDVSEYPTSEPADSYSNRTNNDELSSMFAHVVFLDVSARSVTDSSQ
jgi:hypothetical protein